MPAEPAPANPANTIRSRPFERKSSRQTEAKEKSSPPRVVVPEQHSPSSAAGFGGLAILVCAVLLNAYFLAPELRIGRVPLNDSVFHLAASERLAESLARGEPFLDPWVSEWSLGYPVWRSYQPAGHLLGAAVLRITQSFSSHAASFAALQYLLLTLFPVSIYAGARLFGMHSVAAGLASLFALLPNAAGEASRYGLGYGAMTWRGTGLYTQIIALHFLALSIGCVAQALDHGRKTFAAPALLAATALSHIVFGYVAFVSSALLAILGPERERSRRIIRLATIFALALALLIWFILPLILARHEVNHSRWEPLFKWDSFGAPFILKALFSGQLLDHGRPPFFSILLFAASITAVFSIRETIPKRLLAFTAFWLLLFFGRDTWGHLLLLAGVPADLHLHRLQVAFELSAVLLTGWGTARAIEKLANVNRWLGSFAAIVLAILVIGSGIERAKYLQQNKTWGEENLAAYDRERKDLELAFAAVAKIVAEKPGRVSAGKSGTWGKQFTIGAVPVYAFATRQHFDQVSFLYHAMSLPSDVMVLRDESNAFHDAAFGVRAVVAPASQSMPAHLRLRSRHGRFAVYEASREGYFGLVDIGAVYTGAAATMHETNASWLKASLGPSGVVIAFEWVSGVPSVGRWESFPPPLKHSTAPRGRILSEEKMGETFRARMQIERDCYALIKITWFPDLRATVDGQPARLIRVTPGFAAVPVTRGEHEVVVQYDPSPLKPALFVAGILIFLCSLWIIKRGRFVVAQNFAADFIGRLGVRLSKPGIAAALVLTILILLAMRPLFRGQLIHGHDAVGYPPRLTEMAKALSDWHVPPVWAADLGNGYGEPHFAFHPPLNPGMALPFYGAGFRITDALQISLAFLFAAGAAAIYFLCRRQNASRVSSVATAAVWLFFPYLSLDLFVRAAFAEATGLAIAPVALLGLLRALDQPSPLRIGIGGFAVALVPLAHNELALLLLPALALLVIFRSCATTQKIRSLMAGFATLASGLSLSCYFWIPAILEMQYVKTNLLREGFFHWSHHLASAKQLLWSGWGHGYSVAGNNDGMSFIVGPLHLLLGVAGVLIARRSEGRTQRTEAMVFAAVALAGAFLATSWSASIWSAFGPLQYLTYPWRTLMLTSLFLPLLAVNVLERVDRRKASAFVLLLILINIRHTEPKGYLVYDDEYYASQSIAQKGIRTSSPEAFEPRWVETRAAYRDQKLFSPDSVIEVQQLFFNTKRQEFNVKANTHANVHASTFYYPGWRVTVNGKQVPISPAAGSGMIVFQIPAGTHQVVLQLKPTGVRWTSMSITLAAIIIAFLLILLEARTKLIMLGKFKPNG